MVDYDVTVFTAHLDDAGTLNQVFIKLVGSDGESERKMLTSSEGDSAFIPGTVSSFTVSCPVSIGKLVQIELDKQPLQNPDDWFPAKVEVKSPEGDTYKFYICSWITDSEVHHFKEGRDKQPLPSRGNISLPEDNTSNNKNTDDDKTNVGGTDLGENGHSSPSNEELNQRKKEYRWHVYAEGIPHCMKAEDLSSLPSEVQFSVSKNASFQLTAAAGLVELKLKGLADSEENWPDIDAITGVFSFRRTDISVLKRNLGLFLFSSINDGGCSGIVESFSMFEDYLARLKEIPLDYVEEHWKEDAFFGYQFLNGFNPMLIRRCSALPNNFPVTDDTVFPSGQYSLADEMKRGNIFLCDYKRLDGLKANTIHGKKQYLMAPLVLLHKTPDDKLMPIAIQLKQTQPDDNPIFLPTDSEYDWLIAKIFVRSADFNEHQLNVHLLRTHLLAEAFAVSLLRNLPSVHPLYKLLIPNARCTLHINFLARDLLISDNGVFTKFAASGGEGLTTLLKKSMSSLTYSSLCIKEDIAERGLEGVPNFYYRDNGLKLWDIIHRFAQGMLRFYYKKDAEVQEDSHLQKWILEIFEHGFLSQAGTGIPQSFTTVNELVKFVTMVIFICSGQHSAVNDGQYDYGGWMPNTPISLQLPPPTTKGTTSEATMLQTLPDMGTTANGMAVLWLLSKQPSDFVPLGQYSDDSFSEEIPRQLIKDFQGELKQLSADIKARNTSQEIPYKYKYLDPTEVEGSVAI